MADAILHELALLVGRIDGKLDAHIASVAADRAERSSDRVESEKYRADIRHRFNNLDMKVDAIPRLETRVKTVEDTADSWKSFRLKLTGAILVLSTIIGAIGMLLAYLAPTIKAAILRLFGFSA